jgi:sec-independent protein translocase protein TatC
MPLGDHLDELRRRLLIALVGLLPIIALALVFGQQLLGFILEPAKDALAARGDARQMILTGPLEGFSAYMKVSVIAAITLGSPWLLYQLWLFVSPGLYRHERRVIHFLIPLSFVLTLVGVGFMYTVVMPLMMSFLLDFNAGLGSQQVASAALPDGVGLAQVPVLMGDPPAAAMKAGSMWINDAENLFRVCVSIDENGVPTILSMALKAGVGAASEVRVVEYIKLLLSMTLAFAAAFQAPVVVLLLGWVGILDPKVLKKYRRHALLVCAVAAAVLSPGDPASMLLMLVPLYLLYELGGLLLRIFPARRVAGPTPGDDDDAPGAEEQPDDLEPVANRE